MKTKKIIYLFIAAVFFCIPATGMDFQQREEQPKFFGRFHCFDVGQGNSQFIVYPKEKIGFLYDAGSSSKNKHFKFLSNQKILPFLKLKDENQEDQLFPDFNEEMVIEEAKFQEKRKDSSGSQGSEASNEASDAKNIINIRKSIRETIEKSELNLLFIFLSHPDKDHINFFSQIKDEPDIIPDGLKTIIFACGQFIHNYSEDVDSFIFYAKEEKKKPYVRLIFPYTWGKETTQDFIKYAVNSDKKKQSNDLIQDNFNDFFKKACYFDKEDNPLGEFFSQEEIDRIEGLYDKVFIWGMNFRDNDPNAQSTIMSFKLSNDLSLTVTGDAETSTFKTIVEAAKQTINIMNENEREEILGIKRILIVPHHGAEDNISEEMIDFFKPNLSIISAANGKQFGHPHAKVIKWLSKNINTPIFDELGEKSNSLLYFGQYDDDKWYSKGSKTIKKQENSTLLNSKGKIISTNVVGTIYFEDGMFYKTFSDVIRYKNSDYIIRFSKSSKGIMIEDHKQSILEAFTNNKGVLELQDKLYYVIKEINDKKKNDKIKIYDMIIKDSDSLMEKQ